MGGGGHLIECFTGLSQTVVTYIRIKVSMGKLKNTHEKRGFIQTSNESLNFLSEITKLNTAKKFIETKIENHT